MCCAMVQTTYCIDEADNKLATLTVDDVGEEVRPLSLIAPNLQCSATEPADRHNKTLQTTHYASRGSH